MNRSNTIRIKCIIVTTTKNQTPQKLQSKISTKPTKPNPNKICKETILKQSRKTHHTTSLTPNNNHHHQIVTNSYMQSIIHPNQKNQSTINNCYTNPSYLRALIHHRKNIHNQHPIKIPRPKNAKEL